jgi:hypothetical protein
MASGGRRGPHGGMGEGGGAGGKSEAKDEPGGDGQQRDSGGVGAANGGGEEGVETRQPNAAGTSVDGKAGHPEEHGSAARQQPGEAGVTASTNQGEAAGGYGHESNGGNDSTAAALGGERNDYDTEGAEQARSDDMSDAEGHDEEAKEEQQERGDDDDAMGEEGTSSNERNDGTRTAKKGSEKKPKTLGELYVDLKAAFHQHPDSCADEMSEMASEYFQQLFDAQASHGQRPKAGGTLPNLTTQQAQLLVELFRAQIVGRQGSAATVLSAVRDLVIACFRSTWAFEKLLQQRVSSAQVPAAPPNTAWGKPTGSGSGTSVKTTMTDTSATFRFDPFVYSADDIARLGKICCEPHAFPKKLRQRTDDEWTIMWGIMNGTILARTLPQFMKRCCTMNQFQYFHHFMIERAEGELFAKLPGNLKMYDYNQTTARLSDFLRTSANAQNWKDPRLAEMLAAVKVVSYNEEGHAIHFHFFTKLEATKWENMAIPILRTTVVLQNPDARRREIVTREDGTQAAVLLPPPDGTEDDRYQAPYRCRITNITRPFEVDKLARFLQKITGNAMRMGVPVDTYGPGSQWSLVWDFYALTSNCPTALASINRIMWRDHQLLVIHKFGINAAPCHKCARTGHQMANCTMPEEEWYTEHTLVVTEEDIAQLATARSTWTTPEEAREIFDQLGINETTAEPQTAPASASGDQGTSDAPGASSESTGTEATATAATKEAAPPPAATNTWKTMWPKKGRKLGRDSDGKKEATNQHNTTSANTVSIKPKHQKSNTTTKKTVPTHSPQGRSEDNAGVLTRAATSTAHL